MKKLDAGGVSLIEGHLDVVFARLKARLFGQGQAFGDRMGTWNSQHSMRGLYLAAAQEEGVKVDHEHLKSLQAVAEKYLDGVREQTKARAIQAIHAHLRGDEELDLEGVIRKTMANVQTIVNTEVQRAKQLSLLDGITRVNSMAGIEDPVVFFCCARDKDTCDECRTLSTCGDGHTPKLWLLSELEQGNHKIGSGRPSIVGQHPNCRCTITSVMPGYGFDQSGRLELKARGYLALDVQRR